LRPGEDCASTLNSIPGTTSTGTTNLHCSSGIVIRKDATKGRYVPFYHLLYAVLICDLGWEKFEKTFADDEDPNANKKITPLDEGDIQILKSYGQGPYARALKRLDDEIKEVTKRVNEKIGVKESDMGLAPPNLWDLLSDRQRMSEEHPLQVARCTKIIQNPDDPEKGKYVINVKQIAKFGKQFDFH
jgi:hypothetical protein